jgi:uncharacterized protein YgfB (UPF0149 family)
VSPEPPDYDTLERLLGVSPLSGGASEAHGIYCGLLAVDAPEPRARWLAELLPAPGDSGDGAAPASGTPVATDLSAQDCRDALIALAEHTRAQVEGERMTLDPLLPPADRSLRERAVAVHDWARGFLFGLGLAGIDARALSGPNREVFDDFVELTRMDLNDLDDGEANEQALAEIIEFVRVAALLFYEDRGGGRSH